MSDRAWMFGRAGRGGAQVDPGDDGGMPRRRLPLAVNRWALAYERIAPIAALLVLAILLARGAALVSEAAASPGAIGIDYVDNAAAAVRWVNGESPFLARQMDGPYHQLGMTIYDTGEYLYPPVALPLFVASAYLPAVLWWLIPGILVAGGLAYLRPARWTWPLLLLCAGAAGSITSTIQGNPAIWFLALAMWAPATGWTGPLILLKPPLAPFALLGIRRRAWWISAAVLVLLSIPFGSLWFDWWHAITDMTAMEFGGLLYSVAQWPMMAIAPIAWAGRTTGRSDIDAGVESTRLQPPSAGERLSAGASVEAGAP